LSEEQRMIHYDPYMPEIMEDPHAIYARLRADAPVYYIERFDAWALALFEDIWAASADTEHYSVKNEVSNITLLERRPAAFESLPSMDPPAHDVLRKRLFPHFSPAAARRLEPQIRAWAIECLERHEGRIDAVSELAQQVAVRVGCAINGFPMQDADYLIDVVARFFAREEGTEGLTEAGEKARAEMWDYMARLVAERVKAHDAGQDDVVGKLLAERERWGEAQTLQKLSEHLAILLIAATETFPKVFAGGVMRLWKHPDQRRTLVEDPGLLPTAQKEIFRYEMPTQWLGRTVIRDHEIRGHRLRKGQPVIFLYPSAKRDERECERPEVFDIRRDPERILTFGNGVHRCLGAFFAQMESRVLFEELLRRAPDYEVLEDEAVFPRTEFVQGYASLPIRW
jgi:cytochrome P450